MVRSAAFVNFHPNLDIGFRQQENPPIEVCDIKEGYIVPDNSRARTALRIAYRLTYFLMKCGLWVLLRIFPFELFNKLCLFLPGRLVIYGLRYYGAGIGENVIISVPLTLHNADDRSDRPLANLRIGNDCYIGRELFLDVKERITIEDRVTIAMRVTVLTHTDAARSPLNGTLLRNSAAPVHICRGAYLGACATVLEGVEIGECSVIAAGAVVATAVPPYAVYGGVPARLIKQLEGSL